MSGSWNVLMSDLNTLKQKPISHTNKLNIYYTKSGNQNQGKVLGI